MTMEIRQEVEFKLRRTIKDIGLKIQVTVLFKGVLGVRIVSFDLTIVEAYPGRQAMVEVVTGGEAASQVGTVKLKFGIQVSQIKGGASPRADFKALHVQLCL